MSTLRVFAPCIQVLATAATLTGLGDNFATIDDECLAAQTDDNCALSALQLRGERFAADGSGEDTDVISRGEFAMANATADRSNGIPNSTSFDMGPNLLASKTSGDYAYYLQLIRNEFCGMRLPKMSGVHHLDNGGDSGAAVGRNGDHCVVMMRGAANYPGILQYLRNQRMVPLRGCPGCRVGIGFLRGYRALERSIKAALKSLDCKAVVVTGYSLGAGEAEIAMYDLGKHGYRILPTYLFGEPPSFNAAFHSVLHSIIHTTVFHVVHGADPIARLGRGSAWKGSSLIYEPGNDVVADHFFYHGINMIPCIKSHLPDYLKDGRKTQRDFERVMSAQPGGLAMARKVEDAMAMGFLYGLAAIGQAWKPIFR